MLRKSASIAILGREGRPVLVGLALLLVLLAVWAFSPSAARHTLRERALDLLLPLLSRQSAGTPEVVVVDIDRAALARFGPWPWPRQRMAELVAAAAAGHPTVLAIDILFAGPDRFSADGDAALARALSAVPSVLGFVLETATSGEDLPTTPILFRVPISLPGLLAGQRRHRPDTGTRRRRAGDRRAGRRRRSGWSNPSGSAAGGDWRHGPARSGG